jgi:uncharacterized protein YbjT (DUF2867 family)
MKIIVTGGTGGVGSAVVEEPQAGAAEVRLAVPEAA